MYETTRDILVFSEEDKNNLVEMQAKRVRIYDGLLFGVNAVGSKHQKTSSFSRGIHAICSFWNMESGWENKLYLKFKKWESRHPLMGIFICTILGGIFISLVAGIILEAMMLVF